MLHRLSIALITGTLLLSPIAYAQETGTMPSDDHTAREEAKGKEIWQKMERKEVGCKDFTDEQFATLGEFFMGEMTGDAHEAMNAMMTRMMGEEGEEQMHVVMGKRMSGCGGNGTLPMGNAGMIMPMMGTMMGTMMGGGMMGGLSNGAAPDTVSSMMEFGSGFAPFGMIFMLLWWVLIIAGIVALVKWISRNSDTARGTSALDILKERYAKGEIDKKEFDERKKDLS